MRDAIGIVRAVPAASEVAALWQAVCILLWLPSLAACKDGTEHLVTACPANLLAKMALSTW